MTNTKRKSLLADRNVQGALARRLISYWFVSWLMILVVIIGTIALFSMVIEGLEMSSLLKRLMHNLWFPILISALVLPMILRDCLRISNRFTGPILRFRRAVKELADGGRVEPIKLRDGDFWVELETDFNRLLERVRTLEAGTTSETRSPSATA